jgi:hypothetical protein
LDGALAHLPAPELCLLLPVKGLLALALALQPAIMPCPVRFDGGSLMLQPALVVAEVLFRRAQDLARPRHRLFDDGNSLFKGNGFSAILLILWRPCALLTHRAAHRGTLR